MKAAQLFGPNDLRIVDIDKPKIGEHDVLLKIKKVGICGTDMHLYTGGMQVNYPLILGHEFVGEVVEIGKAVTNLKVGQKAVAEHVLGCGTCDYCHKGQKNLCVTPTVLGIQKPGALAEFMAIPDELVYAIPDSMSWDDGVLVEPLSIAVYVVRRANVNVGDIVAVVGQGPIGLFVDQIATAAGASVYGFDVIDNRLAWAKRNGIVNESFNSKEATVAEIFQQHINANGADFVFEAVGKEPTAALALNLVRAGGKVMMMGVFEKPIAVDMMRVVKNEITIEGNWTCIFSFKPTIELLKSGKIHTQGLITHRYPFAEAQKAFTEALEYSDNRIKSVIEF